MDEITKPQLPSASFLKEEADAAVKKAREQFEFLNRLSDEQNKNLPKVMAQEKADFERLQKAKARLAEEARTSPPTQGYDASPEKTKLDPLEDVKVRDIDIGAYKKAKQGALSRMLGKVGSGLGKAINVGIPALMGKELYEHAKEGDAAKMATDVGGIASLFTKNPMAQAILMGATLPVDQAREMAGEEQELKELEAYRKGEKLRHNYTDEEFSNYLAKQKELMKTRKPANK